MVRKGLPLRLYRCVTEFPTIEKLANRRKLIGGPRTMAGVIDRYYNNNYENIGDKTSFVWYGKSNHPIP